MRQRVLVVDDEADLRTVLRHNLENAGYVVRTAVTGEEGVAIAIDFLPDLVVLDVMLPDLSGMEVCRRLRALGDLPQPVVMMLSARSAEIDRVAGFEVGADDYVVKPFSVRELLLRISSRLKARVEPKPLPLLPEVLRECIAVGGWELELDGNWVFVGGVAVALTDVEARLLAHLVRAPGVVHTRETMVGAIWGSQDEVVGRTIDTNIKRLRQKLGPAGPVIETVRGIGYRFAEPSSPPSALPRRN
jgi:two-component system, OmpR family, phosphate regulon response regulator PhoB